MGRDTLEDSDPGGTLSGGTLSGGVQTSSDVTARHLFTP